MKTNPVTIAILLIMILSTLACGLVDQVLEPETTLAPPPTIDGLAPTSTVAPDGSATELPGAPTPTLAVSPTPGAATLEELGAPPDSLDALQGWVAQARAANVPVEDLCTVLGNAQGDAQWRQVQDTCSAADLDGDGQEEWLITLDTSRLQEEQAAPLQEGHPGDFWIVNTQGVAYQVRENEEPDFFATAPELVELVDMTGDEQPEAVVVFSTCGAHTCYNYYQIIGAHGGPLRNLVQLSEQDDTLPESLPETISLSYVDREEIRDETEDDLPDLVIHGGIVGSAGAGIQRARTEIWAWSGQAITLAEQQWEETAYRFHRLYNANYAFEQQQYDVAGSGYEDVIVNPDLEDEPFATGTAEELRDHTRQFAAFRLTLLPLLRGDITDATRWRNWLQGEYPEAAITAASERLLSEWETNGNNLAAACNEVNTLLQSSDNPTGPLVDMGYNNPSLTPETLCPIE